MPTHIVHAYLKTIQNFFLGIFMPKGEGKGAALLFATLVFFLSAGFVFGAEEVPVVMVAKTEAKELSDTMTYPTRVHSKVQAIVKAPIDGVVSKLNVTLGSMVRRGQALLFVKNTDPVYEYVPVRVGASVSGAISAVEVTEGTKVTKDQPLVTITDPKQIRLMVEVPASDLSMINKGLKGHFQVNGIKQIDIIVSGVSPMVDPATGTATAELLFVDPKSAATVPLGLIGKVSFAVNKRQGVQIPEHAIVYRGKETFVRVVENNKAKIKPVVIASTQRGLCEISSGLEPNETVILRSSRFVADGQTVTIQEGDVVRK